MRDHDIELNNWSEKETRTIPRAWQTFLSFDV